MGRMFLMSVAMLCVGGAAWAQSDDNAVSQNKTTIGGDHPELAAGARAIRAGRYDKGIEQTLSGLEAETPRERVRAAALSNLCAAYAAKEDPDTAIDYCTRALEINATSWRALSNRSYAHWLKGNYAEAALDVDAAALIAPKARQVRRIRGMINEASLEPRIVIEEHQ